MYQIKKVLGKNVRFYRKKRGFTQENLAEEMNVESGYVSKVERGIMNVRIEYVQKFAIALNVKASDLFKEVGDGE